MTELWFANEWTGAAALGGFFVAILAIAETWHRLGSPSPEMTRKFVHVTGGLGCLSFPWLVSSWAIVGAMATALALAFGLAKKYRLLPSLHSVERSSRGAEYYPIAIFLVFLLSDGRPWLYVASILTLAVADGFAALVGGRYGTLRYRIEDGTKSLEGSLVFLVLTFLAVHLPALLLGDVAPAVSVVAAFHVALIVTGLEAIALRGTDNLWVPLGVAYILTKVIPQPLPEIIYQNLSLVALAVGIGLAAWRFPLFRSGAALVFILFAYGCWALGGWPWAVPLLSSFFFFLLSWSVLPPTQADERIGVRTIQRAVIPVFAILLLANTLHEHHQFFGPFLAANATVVSLGLAPRVLLHAKSLPAMRAFGLVISSLLASLAVVLVSFLLQDDVPFRAPLAIAAVALGTTIFHAQITRRNATEGAATWPWSRTAWSVGAAVVIYWLQMIELIPPWSPHQRW